MRKPRNPETQKPRNPETQKFNWSKSYLILLFAGIFIFNSCEKDAVTDKQQIEIAQPTFKVKTLSKNDISTRSHVQQALNKVKKQLNPDLNTKIVYDSINNIWINDNNVNYVTSGNYESYTFGVYDPNAPDDLKNLILHKQSDSTFTPILTKYIKSSIDNSIIDVEYSLLNSMSFQFSQKNTHIGERLQPCNMSSDCKCWMIVGFDDDGNALISIKDDCAEQDNSSSPGGGYDDGDSSGDDDSSNDSNTGTGAGSNPPGDGTANGDGEGSGGFSGTSTNDGNNLPIVTKPVKLTREEILTNQLNELAEELDFTWQFESVVGNTIELNTEEQIRAFLANGSSWDGIYNEIFDTQSNQTRLKATKEIYPGRNINIDIRYTKDNPNTRVNEFQMNENDISTWLDGYASMGSVWTQQRSYIRDEYGDPNIAWVEITGVYSFLGKILGENIGFSKTKVITIRINKQTGEVIQLF